MSNEITEGIAVYIANSCKNKRLLDNFDVATIYKYVRIKQEIKVKGFPLQVIIEYRVFPNLQFDYYETCNEMTFEKFFKVIQPT